MKNKKRSWALLLAGVLSASCLSGCGQSNIKQEETQKQTESPSVLENSTEVSQETETQGGPITTDPITISILTGRMSNATNDADDIWYFKYLEWWMNEQGYNVTIDVQQTSEMNQQLSLLLGTNSLPDLIWGTHLTEDYAVMYGQGEGMILDWTPYLNEETMPNLYGILQENQNALAASTLPDGGIFGLPYLSTNSEGSNYTTFGMVDRMYVNTKWLEQCDLEMPTDLDGFLDMLRAFKNVELESGEEVIPAVSNVGYFGRYFWMGLGWYGADFDEYGTMFAIKDGKVNLPAATEDYRTFIEIMKTCYEEGLISPDYFTMDATTARGYMKAGTCGVLCDYTLGNTEVFSDWVAVPPILIGDNDQIVVSASANYTTNTVWASADTEYPEVLAMLMDYVYSPEGTLLYFYGPKQGEDPLEMLDGWYYDENQKLTTKLVADGTYSSIDLYARQYVYSTSSVGNKAPIKAYSMELAGLENTVEQYVGIDAITGESILGDKRNWVYDTADGWWRFTTSEVMAPYMTEVRLPAVYMAEEESLRAVELSTVINQYIQSETAKFITGIRPISELDAYYEELKAMDVEEYIEMYQAAYSDYINSVFNK